MSDINAPQENGIENEQFPVEPRYHPVNKLARLIYDALASSRLAITLLIVILVSCVCGVTLFREQQAAEIVFRSVWFNGLLILLVINTACCFFGRMWGRKLTVISFGMILFHLSFVAMFLSIVFNSLFAFDGVLRLTEGETLSNRDPKSYDIAHPGFFFSYARLKGETTLLQVHRGYKVDGGDKLVAFDISLAEGGDTQNATIYVNNKFVHKAVEYIRDREGYSLLGVVNDRNGKELYGAHIPLQSYKQKDGSYIYGTGTNVEPGAINFPPENEGTLFGLQVDYFTDNQKDRNGRVRFRTWPASKKAVAHTGNAMSADVSHASGSGHTGDMIPAGVPHGGGAGMTTVSDNEFLAGGGHASGAPGSGSMTPVGGQSKPPLAEGTVNVNEKFNFGEYQLYVPEVRYWVAMNVRYNPGKPFVLASLWVGLAGMIITTLGRMFKRKL